MGKTTRSARYDLNQILYEYEVEVTNRFKGLKLINSVPEELQIKVHNIVQEALNKPIPKKKKNKKPSGYLRRPYKQLKKVEEQKARERRKGIFN